MFKKKQRTKKQANFPVVRKAPVGHTSERRAQHGRRVLQLTGLLNKRRSGAPAVMLWVTCGELTSIQPPPLRGSAWRGPQLLADPTRS